MKKLTKKQIKAIESCNWSVREYEDYYCLESYSPYGEDMIIEVDKNNAYEDIINYCDSYDIDEHFKLWYGANRGEPQSPASLLKDCEEQADMYEKLADALKEAK